MDETEDTTLNAKDVAMVAGLSVIGVVTIVSVITIVDRVKNYRLMKKLNKEAV